MSDEIGKEQSVLKKLIKYLYGTSTIALNHNHQMSAYPRI